MNTFKLTVSSPDGNKFQGDVVKLDVRGTEGELAIMAGHIPFVSYVKPCECKIELENEEVKSGKIQSGILTVSKEEVILLCGGIAWN